MPEPFLLYDTSGGLTLSVVRTPQGLLFSGHAVLSGEHLDRFVEWVRAVA